MVRFAFAVALVAVCAIAAVLNAGAATLHPASSIVEPSPQPDARFGSALATGDVNGDGAEDVIVGSTGAGSGQLQHSGEVNVFLGPSFAHHAVLYSPSGFPRFGEAVAAGDVNGDGFDDVIASSRYAHVGAQLNAGEVFVFFGPALTAWQVLYDPVPQSSAAFGISVAAGDTNDDGFDEVVVGAWDSNHSGFTKAGEAFVFTGPSLTSVTTLRSPAPQNVADFGVATAVGDFDGDGNGDVIVGSWVADYFSALDTGQAFVFHGPTLTPVTPLYPPSTTLNRMGRSVAAGDIDGDGRDEVIAGATGVAIVFDYTAPNAYSTDELVLPSTWNSSAVTGVAAADATGDGIAEIVIGAPQRSGGGASGLGGALIYAGTSGAEPYVLETTPLVAGAEFGWRVALVNGHALVAAPGHSSGSIADAGVLFDVPIADSDNDGRLNAGDNCPNASNTAQTNTDDDFVDLSPPKAFDDFTWPRSDTAGDACDGDDDNDGVPDGTESALPSAACPSASAATDPLQRDSDGDLALDGAECQLGTDPASTASVPPISPANDTDRDGLSDAVEASLGTNAGDSDTDGDGIVDGLEVRAYHSAPLATDSDGDGCPDGREIASINGDRAVTAIDLAQVAQSFGPSGSAAYFAHFDVNRDARISAIDLSMVAQQFGAC